MISAAGKLVDYWLGDGNDAWLGWEPWTIRNLEGNDVIDKINVYAPIRVRLWRFWDGFRAKIKNADGISDRSGDWVLFAELRR